MTHFDNSIGNPFEIKDVPDLISKGRNVVCLLYVHENGFSDKRIAYT